MEKEIARTLFDRFAKSGETFDVKWIERFEDMIIEEGEVVGTHSWNSGAPGAGAGVTYIYRFRGLFFTSTDFGIDGPYKGFSEAAEDVSLLTLMYPLIFTRCRTPGRRIGFGAGVLRIARRAAAAVPRACWG